MKPFPQKVILTLFKISIHFDVSISATNFPEQKNCAPSNIVSRQNKALVEKRSKHKN